MSLAPCTVSAHGRHSTNGHALLHSKTRDGTFLYVEVTKKQDMSQPQPAGIYIYIYFAHRVFRNYLNRWHFKSCKISLYDLF